MYKRKPFSFFKSKIIISIILLIAVEPEYFSSIQQIDDVYNVLQLICCILLLGIAVASRPFTKSRVWIFVFYGSIFLNTILNSGDLWHFITGNGMSFILCLVFDLWLHKSPGTLIDSFSILDWFVIANLLTVLIWPDGLYHTELYTKNWLFGYKNVHIRTILPIVCMAMIRSYWKYKRLSFGTILLIACVIFTIIKVDSATSLIGLSLFVLLLILLETFHKWLPRLINLKTSLVVVMFILFLVIATPVRDSLIPIFEKTVGHASTFAVRLDLWDKAVKMFLKRPLFGYGYLTGGEFTEIFNAAWAAHPHNYFLYVLLIGGIFQLLIVFYGVLLSASELRRARSALSSKIILSTLICFFVMGISESLTSTHLLYPMLILAMNATVVSDLQYERNSDHRRVKFVLMRRRYSFKIGFGNDFSGN